MSRFNNAVTFAKTDLSNVSSNTIAQAASLSIALGDLSNVNVSTVVNGQTIIFDSGSQKWINGSGGGGGSSTLSGLTDVNIVGVTNDQVLTYNSGSSKWQNQSLATSQISDYQTETQNIANVQAQEIFHTQQNTDLNKSIFAGVEIWGKYTGVAYELSATQKPTGTGSSFWNDPTYDISSLSVASPLTSDNAYFQGSLITPNSYLYCYLDIPTVSTQQFLGELSIFLPNLNKFYIMGNLNPLTYPYDSTNVNPVKITFPGANLNAILYSLTSSTRRFSFEIQNDSPTGLLWFALQLVAFASQSTSELTDANITSVQDGDRYTYNSTSSKWENKVDTIKLKATRDYNIYASDDVVGSLFVADSAKGNLMFMNAGVTNPYGGCTSVVKAFSIGQASNMELASVGVNAGLSYSTDDNVIKYYNSNTNSWQNISSGGSLATLSDVQLSSPATLDRLEYNAISGKWENKNNSVIIKDVRTARLEMAGSEVQINDSTNGCLFYLNQTDALTNGGLQNIKTFCVGNGATTLELSANGVQHGIAYNITTDKLNYYSDGTGTWVELNDAGSNPSLGQLSDVNLTTPSNLDILTYNAAGTEWINASRNNFMSVYQLSDVDYSGLGPVTGQVIKYTGTKYENAGMLLSEMDDVNLTTPSVNNILQYTGSDWINKDYLTIEAGSNDYDLYGSSNNFFIRRTPVNQDIFLYNSTQNIVGASSSTYGLKLGSGTTTQLNSISPAPTSCMAHNTSTNIPQFHNGTSWKIVGISDIDISYNSVGIQSNTFRLTNISNVFRVEDNTGNSLLSIDKSATPIKVQFSPDQTGFINVGSVTSDPTATNGSISYNSTTNKFRGYQNGAWTDMIGGGGGSGWALTANTLASDGLFGSLNNFNIQTYASAKGISVQGYQTNNHFKMENNTTYNTYASLQSAVAGVSNAVSIAISACGNYAYTVYASAGNLLIWDVHTTPTLPISKVNFTLTGGASLYCSVQGNLLFTENASSIISIYNIKNPITPVLIDGSVIVSVKGWWVVGNYFYCLTNSRNVFRIYDISGVPVQLSTTTISNQLRSVIVRGDYAYIIGTHLIVYNISNKFAPTLVTAAMPLFGQNAGAGDYILCEFWGNYICAVGRSFCEIILINISNPAIPITYATQNGLYKLITTTQQANVSMDIQICDNYLYTTAIDPVTTNNKYIYCYDLLTLQVSVADSLTKIWQSPVITTGGGVGFGYFRVNGAYYYISKPDATGGSPLLYACEMNHATFSNAKIGQLQVGKALFNGEVKMSEQLFCMGGVIADTMATDYMACKNQLVLPRVPTASLTSYALQGSLVYDTTSNTLKYYNSNTASWKEITAI